MKEKENFNEMEIIDYTKEKSYLKAQKKVKEIKGFYAHLVVMIFLLPFLVIINLKFSPQYHWFWWAIIGNLIGLFFHWFGVFGIPALGFGRDWEERKIRELMNDDK